MAQQIITEEKIARSKPIGLAFVTFRYRDHNILRRIIKCYPPLRTVNSARSVLQELSPSWFVRRRQGSDTAWSVGAEQWKVWYAPPPSDIVWEHLPHQHWTYIKKILANLAIFLVAFFLTTPQFVVHLLDPILTALKRTTKHHQHKSVLDNVRLSS